ncbi:MAG: hypothetical protein Q4C98_07770, partial [Capnocytophaga sp.]|nr:hypothetical protein [Capnocytophaga sp.]
MVEQIKKFLSNNPNQNLKKFSDNEGIIWIDWREYDEDIVSYVFQELSPKENFKYEIRPTDKERGEDIVLKKDGKEHIIPYQDDAMDRDTTLKSVGEFIADQYTLCWFKASLGSDTLGFVVLKNDDYTRLLAEFGEEKVKYFFSPVTEEKAMFELDMDEVFSMIEERK